MKFFALFLTLMLAGCFFDTAEEVNPETKAEKSQLFIGKYIYGAEVSSFQACHSSEGFWLNGNKDDMDIISEASLALAKERKEPYQEIYVEFLGTPDLTKPVGFAQDYDGTFTLQKLLKFTTKIPDDC